MMKVLSRILMLCMAGLLPVMSAHVFAQEDISGETAPKKSSAKEDVSEPVFPPDAQLYTACNLWYERPDALWCINYKRGKIIPAGTVITDFRIAPGLTGSRRGKPTMFFTTPKDGKEYQLHFDPPTHPRLTIQDYAKRMFTTKTFSELTKGMTKTEMEAIRQGKLKVGMSRKAVLVAWGYPPEHRTPSLDEDVWIYWTARFRRKNIHFDENGKTMREPGLDPDDL